MRYILALILTLVTSQAFGASAAIVAAFGTLSTATGGKVSAAQTGTNTLQVIGATVGKTGGKPTVTVGRTPLTDVYVDDFGNSAAAIIAAVSRGDNIRVHFNRMYTITTYIQISNNNVQLVADVPGAGITQTGTAQAGFIFTGSDGVVDGLTIIGNNTGSMSSYPYTYGAGVSAFRTSGLIVRNCIVKHWGSPGHEGAGIYFSGSKHCQAIGNKVDDCINGINDDDYGASRFNTYQSVGNVIDRNIVSSSTATGISIDFQATETYGGNDPTGIESAPLQSKGTRVTNNEVYGTKLNGGAYGNGITFDDVNGGQISGNYAHDNEANGILLWHKTIHTTVNGNKSVNNGWYGLQSASDSSSVPSYNTISGANTFSYNALGGVKFSNGNTGVQLSGAMIRNNGGDGVSSSNFLKISSIKGCTITGNAHHGIHLTDAFTVTIEGNTVQANGTAAANTYDNILIDKSAFDYYGIRILNNIFSTSDTGVTYSMEYDIKLASNSNSRLCAIIGNTGATIFDGATGTDYGDLFYPVTILPATLSGSNATLNVEQGNYFNIDSNVNATITTLAGSDPYAMKIIRIQAFGTNLAIHHSGAPGITLFNNTDVAMPAGGVVTLAGTSLSGWREIGRNFTATKIITVADGSTSINVQGINQVNLNNASPTTITSFTGGVPNQELELVSFINSNNIVGTAVGTLKFPKNAVMPNGGHMRFKYNGANSTWEEQWRSWPDTTPTMVWSNKCDQPSTGAGICAASFTISQPITITRFQARNFTVGVGCSTWPVYGIWDATASSTLTSITTAASTTDYDTTPISVNVAAGHQLQLKVLTAGVGCSTAPASTSFMMQYQPN